MLETIRSQSHPTDVVADSSVFAPDRLDLVRQLLIERRLRILPEVARELGDLLAHTTPLRDLVFPGGDLNPRLEQYGHDVFQGYERVAAKYVNLLHTRKRLLEKAQTEFELASGRKPVGRERASLAQKVQAASGASWRTLRLGTKGDPLRRYTDETLAAHTVLSPIISGRDCFVLTADADVFDQFFQLTQLLHDDYGSFLLGEDFRANPGRYPHSHAHTSPFMKPGARAFGRESEPNRLLPSIAPTCASWVINVSDGSFLTWVATRNVGQALRFQNQQDDGRVADAGGGLGLHISMGEPDCRECRAHFTVGSDELALVGDTIAGRIALSRFDLYRAASDKPVPVQTRARIAMRGTPVG